jgi:hypothetical protein
MPAGRWWRRSGGRAVAVPEDGLAGVGFQEGLGIVRAGFALPDDAGGRDVESG